MSFDELVSCLQKLNTGKDLSISELNSLKYELKNKLYLIDNRLDQKYGG